MQKKKIISKLMCMSTITLIHRNLNFMLMSLMITMNFNTTSIMCFNYIPRLENSVEITPENLQNTADEHVR